MIVLDTHAWIWWLSDPGKLSLKAAAAIEQAAAKSAICVSAMSVWEFMMLVRRGRLELAMPPEEWLSLAEGLPAVRFLPVTNAIAVKSVNLPAIHNDPTDRIIIATASVHGGVLVTKDDVARQYTEVRTIW
ncbi:MAG: type II toxin-antitoxin system VapC family toxin [Nitrospirae bacterium]|nr:type II toxin-antitoxin system VapC family toxin [Nitrospirota bacterium]